jgi:predicted membrane chloride channel (bestrophin family)
MCAETCCRLGSGQHFQAGPQHLCLPLQMLSATIGASTIMEPGRVRMDENLTFFEDALGACERILKTPIPLTYTR